MEYDEIDYKIVGDDLQLVEIELDPKESVIAEAGAMTYMEEDISFEAKMGDGSRASEGFFSSAFSSVKRVLAGESAFITHFTNNAQNGAKRHIAFAAPYPGKIIPIDLSEANGNQIFCQKDAFLCAALGTRIDISFSKRLGRGFFGGEGFILEKLSGFGKVFLHAGGTIIKRELRGDKLLVDTGCLVAFTSGINYDIEKAGNLKTMLLGGEGLFLATLQGYGTVYVQSLPFSRLADRILANAPSAGGKSAGEGSLIGGIGDMLSHE